MPAMIQAYRKYAPRGYEMIAVAVRDPPESVANFTRRSALPFKVAVDRGGEIAKQFGNVRITPTTFVIDKKGRLIKRYIGEPEWSDFNRVVERALAEPA